MAGLTANGSNNDGENVMWYDCPLELKHISGTKARMAIRGINGHTPADLTDLLPEPCALLLQSIFRDHPQASNNRTLLNQLVREALHETEAAKISPVYETAPTPRSSTVSFGKTRRPGRLAAQTR